MFQLITKIPSRLFVAVSGGVDSMVALDFVSRNSNRQIGILHINHGTDHGKIANEFVHHIADKYNKELFVHTISQTKPKNESWEEFWRNERYRFFHSFSDPVISAHHLQDCVEWYVLSSLRGCSKLISVNNQNVIRPFLLCSKTEFINWSIRKNVEFVQDESNFENVHDRNIVRNEMMETILKINPGIEKTVKKLLLKREQEMRNQNV